MPHVRIQVYTYPYVPTLHFPMTVCAMPSPFATRFIAVWSLPDQPIEPQSLASGPAPSLDFLESKACPPLDLEGGGIILLTSDLIPLNRNISFLITVH